MTGPIRPSERTVVDVVSKMKQQIPDALVHVFTWKYDSSLDELQSVVDTLCVLDEISSDDIQKMVTTRSGEYYAHRGNGNLQLAENILCNTFRMIGGVGIGIKSLQCDEDDIVIRIRTDCVFLFVPGYLTELIEKAKSSYVVRSRKSSGCMFDDWFAITTYKILKRVWSMGLNEYNSLYAISLNPEDMIRRRCDGIPIVRMDESKIEPFLYREDNFTRYYLE